MRLFIHSVLSDMLEKTFTKLEKQKGPVIKKRTTRSLDNYPIIENKKAS